MGIHKCVRDPRDSFARQIFLAAISAGEKLGTAMRRAKLNRRQVARLIAFTGGFAEQFEAAKVEAERHREHPTSDDALRAKFAVEAAITDRTTQEQADRYAGGDVERYLEMVANGSIWKAMCPELERSARRQLIGELGP